MEENLLYIQLKQLVIDNGYTITQVKNVTHKQVANLLGTRNFTKTFLDNAKKKLIDHINNANDQTNMLALKAQAQNWLDANFPDAEVERGREEGKPFVKVWLEGKP